MSSLSEDFDLFEGVDEKSLAGADFTAEVIGELRRAFSGLRDSSDLTQKTVADRLGVSKSAVHRWLYGDGNMTVRKLGELVWAMHCRSTLKITAELIPEASDTVRAAGALASAAPLPADTKPDAALGWYRLTPIALADAKAVRVSGAPLNLTGYSDSAFIQGRVLPVGQNSAIVQFRGLRMYDPSFTENRMLPEQGRDDIVVERRPISDPISQSHTKEIVLIAKSNRDFVVELA